MRQRDPQAAREALRHRRGGYQLSTSSCSPRTPRLAPSCATCKRSPKRATSTSPSVSGQVPGTPRLHPGERGA
eukprot:scaffold71021_cov33-Tisochrysis_lutea.AAC.1